MHALRRVQDRRARLRQQAARLSARAGRGGGGDGVLSNAAAYVAVVYFYWILCSNRAPDRCNFMEG